MFIISLCHSLLRLISGHSSFVSHFTTSLSAKRKVSFLSCNCPYTTAKGVKDFLYLHLYVIHTYMTFMLSVAQVLDQKDWKMGIHSVFHEHEDITMGDGMTVPRCKDQTLHFCIVGLV